MFLDSEDYEHLVNRLNYDIPLLIKKMDEMKSTIVKNLDKRKYYEPLMKSKSWRNHETNVKWCIYYNVAKDFDGIVIKFIPITSFNNKDGTKNYFVFCLEVFNSYSAEHHLFKIFRGHFINRYLQRTKSEIEKEEVDSELKAHGVILGFVIHQDLTINYNHKQNEKWFMHIDSKGVAMIRKDRFYQIFDTFLTLSDLKPDQNNAIRQYLDDLLLNNPVQFIITLQLISMDPGKGWDRFFTKEKIEIAYRSAYKINPELTLLALKYIQLFTTV